MSIIEKLGIKQIERRYVSDYQVSEGYIPVCRDEDVEELEDIRDKLLEALVRQVINFEANKNILPRSMWKSWNDYTIPIIERACYPKSWEEIKQLL